MSDGTIDEAGGYTLLWSKILKSTIWDHSAATRIVWITLLAMKNKDGIVISSVSGLRRWAAVTHEECQTALDIFLSPDPDSSSKVDEGRRIRVVPGGWFIINHEAYRYATVERKEFWRQAKAEQRAKKEAAAKLRAMSNHKLPSAADYAHGQQDPKQPFSH